MFKDLEEELAYAEEGLMQMQEPEAGYFEDPEHPTPQERAVLDRDIESQCKAIDRINRKIANRDKNR